MQPLVKYIDQAVINWNKIIVMDFSQFPPLLEKVLIEWRILQTRKRQPTSLNAFATYLDFSRPIISQWLNGDRRPTHENAERLLPKMIELIGDEAYDAFGLSHPDPILATITHEWGELTQQQQEDIHQTFLRYLDVNKTRRK